jgi:branched-chain amino acid transport system permease protein
MLLRSTDLGRAIRAVRGNPTLARIMGVDPDRIYLVVFAIGSVFCGAAGVLNGARFAVLPDMGDRPVILAFVVAFLGGTRRSPLAIGLAGLFIGLIESISGQWVSPQWTSLVVFTVLFVYLILHPFDLRSLLPLSLIRRN